MKYTPLPAFLKAQQRKENDYTYPLSMLCSVLALWALIYRQISTVSIFFPRNDRSSTPSNPFNVRGGCWKRQTQRQRREKKVARCETSGAGRIIGPALKGRKQ